MLIVLLYFILAELPGVVRADLGKRSGMGKNKQKWDSLKKYIHHCNWVLGTHKLIKIDQ